MDARKFYSRNLKCRSSLAGGLLLAWTSAFWLVNSAVITAQAKDSPPQRSVAENPSYPPTGTSTWRSRGAGSIKGAYFTQLIAEAETKTASTTPASGTIQLEGKAERTEMDLGAAENALKDYKQAYNYLSAGKFGPAAELFKRAGDQFDQGFERYRGESRYAEAQCRRMLGQKAASSSLYQAAIKIFKEHDPESPYLKAAIEQLGNIELKVQQARLDAPPRKLEGAIDIDRNVTLQGRIGEDGVRLSGRKALLEVEKKFIDDSIHQCFTEMTCLETAELGSNSTNAKNRWTPLLAYGNPTAVLASDDYFTPLIKVKINGKRYNVNIDLPGLTSHQQTVLLLTDGEKICAIDPATNDVWLLKVTFKKDGNTQFKFKKLLHQKDFKFKKPVSKQSSALDRLLNRTAP